MYQDNRSLIRCTNNSPDCNFNAVAVSRITNAIEAQGNFVANEMMGKSKSVTEGSAMGPTVHATFRVTLPLCNN
jgi:hypothetical protein